MHTRRYLCITITYWLLQEHDNECESRIVFTRELAAVSRKPLAFWQGSFLSLTRQGG